VSLLSVAVAAWDYEFATLIAGLGGFCAILLLIRLRVGLAPEVCGGLAERARGVVGVCLSIETLLGERARQCVRRAGGERAVWTLRGPIRHSTDRFP
jgi:hypothetical protein